MSEPPLIEGAGPPNINTESSKKDAHKFVYVQIPQDRVSNLFLIQC